jgi:methionyl-tRNA synthetase
MTRVDSKQLDALFGPATETPTPTTAGSAKARDPASAPLPEGIISIDDFARVVLKIARIVHAETVPGSDKLLKLSLDIGEARHRTVFSGIRVWYQPEQLIGRLTVAVTNLAPRTMKFGVSEAMVLAASTQGDQGGVFLLEPHSGAQPGMQVR